MTLNEMILETWEMLGKPTDITPLDRLDDVTTINPDLVGYKQLKRWVNLGYKAITTWRTPGGQFFRSKDMIDRKYLQWGPHTITGSHTTTTDDSEDGYDSTQHLFEFPEDNFYVNNEPPAMVLLGLSTLGQKLPYEEVTPETLELQELDPEYPYWQVYQVLEADWVSLAYFIDDHTLYTLEPLPWVIDESVPVVYERGLNWKRFSDNFKDFYAIRQLRVIDNKYDMVLASRTENFTNNLTEVGMPQEYFREGDYIYFDRHIDKEYTLQIEYYKQAKPLENTDDEPDIQERFHTPIVYWAAYRGLLRYGENKDAYSLRGFLDSEMRSIIKEDDLDIERYEGNFIGGNN